MPDDVAFSEAGLVVAGRRLPVNPTAGLELQRYATRPDGTTNTYIGSGAYTSRIVVVPPDQALQPVRLCRDPAACVPSWAATTDQMMRGVDVRGRYIGGGLPIPEDVPLPAQDDTDASIVFYQPGYVAPNGRRGRLYEAWRFRVNPGFDASKPVSPDNTRYVAAWGGRVVGVNGAGPGHYVDCTTDACGYQADVTADPSAWGRADSQAQSRGWGATATGLIMTASQMTIGDCRRGSLDHGIGIEVPYANAGRFWWPAQRGDGVAGDKLITEGMRLTFPRGSSRPEGLTAVGRVLWDAAYRYGVVIDDQTASSLGFRAEPGCKETELFKRDGLPAWELLRGFPWRELRVIAEGSDATPNPTS